VRSAAHEVGEDAEHERGHEGGRAARDEHGQEGGVHGADVRGARGEHVVRVEVQEDHDEEGGLPRQARGGHDGHHRSGGSLRPTLDRDRSMT
jgi:hypothetical protein